MRLHPVPLDGPRTLEELQAVAGSSITPEGLGGLGALKLFGDELAKACLSNDHPRYLSFIPCAPTEAAAMFDLVVGASGIYAGSWLEGAGAVYAENLALRWIADLAGLPPQAGGVFVPGGTIGNLSALVTARSAARARHTSSGSQGPRPTKVAAQIEAHSSITTACEVMDAELIGVRSNEHQRLSGDNLRAVLEAEGPETFFAVVATAGTTNFGIVDDLESVAQVWPRLRSDPCMPGSSTPTPSSSTPTSGCSRRSTAVPCCIAIPPWPAQRTPRGRRISMCSPMAPSGTRATTRSG